MQGKLSRRVRAKKAMLSGCIQGSCSFQEEEGETREKGEKGDMSSHITDFLLSGCHPLQGELNAFDVFVQLAKRNV